jgi:hypothetical protein
MMAEKLQMHKVPDEWELLRIEGRKHHEVVTHIAIDDTVLCGANQRHMIWDDSPFLMPTGHVYNLYGATAVIHSLCRKCLKKAIKRELSNIAPTS